MLRGVRARAGEFKVNVLRPVYERFASLFRTAKPETNEAAEDGDGRVGAKGYAESAPGGK